MSSSKSTGILDLIDEVVLKPIFSPSETNNVEEEKKEDIEESLDGTEQVQQVEVKAIPVDDEKVDEASETELDIPEAKAEEVDISKEEKLGGKCCGCCCDYRRAVIVMASLAIVYTGLLAAGFGTYGYFTLVMDDDSAFNEAAGITSFVGAGAYALMFLFYIFQLIGAICYNLCMLVTVVIFEFIGLGFDIYLTYYGSTSFGVETSYTSIAMTLQVLYAAFIIYPTIGLIREISDGTMSAATYPRESYKCCCPAKKV